MKLPTPLQALRRTTLPLRLAFAEDASALRARVEAAGVERTFFVCSTPRTGSTMLGDLLADTGLVGRAGEYFGEAFHANVIPGLDRGGFDDYLVDCTRHARGTGVLGVKLHWDQVQVFMHLLRMRKGVRSRGDREVIEAVFPGPQFIWLRRGDELAQAVSWWKAMTSGKWTDGRPVTDEARFDFGGIRSRLMRVAGHNDAWADWFSSNHIEPLALTYEELVADSTLSVRRVLAHVGVEVPADLVAEPRTERQADEVNEDWIHRYRDLAGRERAGESGRETLTPRRRAVRPVQAGRRRFAATAVALASVLLLLFVGLPEALGDFPYNALGH